MRFRFLRLSSVLLVVGILVTACAEPTLESDTPAAPTSTPTPTVLPTWTTVPSPVPGGLYVDADLQLGAISPYVFGTNYGPFVSLPYDFWPQAQAAEISFIRYPGGSWGDEYDLQTYQIDDLINISSILDAEPHICVRLGPEGTPEAAAELVRYANVENDYNVRYWAIGNEPNLYGDGYGTDEYNRDWRAIAEAMLEVDPDILLLGPDVSQYTDNPAENPKDDEGRDWMREFLLANGDLVDVVMIHRYPYPDSKISPPATIDDLRSNVEEWDQIIPYLRSLIRETTGRDIPVGVGEINSHWSHVQGGEATPDSFYNAIWLGDILGRLIRQRVDVVAHFMLVSPGSLGGWGLFSRFEIRPSYYVYLLYKQFGNELVYSSSDDLDVSITAALREDGALTLVIINLGPDEVSKSLMLSDGSPSGSAEVWLFDVDHPFELVAESTVTNGDSITLPGQSITLIIIGAN